ncbi:MAG: fimbrillin family protein [Rikenellaceae bacterium]
MKKVLLFAFAVAAMASCAKTEVVDINLDDPNIIGFSTYVGATRADVTSASIIEGSGVGVYAAVNGTDITADSPTFHIPNAKLTGVGTDNTNTVAPEDGFGVAADSQWSTSTSYYWPVANALDFYAYYPFVGTDGVTAFDTTGYVNDTSSAKGEWEIAATADAQEDYLAGIVTNKTVDDGTVMLDLDHLLSKVDFQVGVQSENSSAILAVTINSIKLEGIENQHQGLDLSVPELKAASTASYNGAYTYAAAADPTAAEANIVLAQTTTSVLYSVDNNILTDAGRFNASNNEVDGYVAAGTTNSTSSYADINSGTATTGAESFKLLPQTLLASSTLNSSSPFQRVTLNYSITQNGYDIVGSGDIKYKYTVVFWSNTGAETTSGLTAGTDPVGNLIGADGLTAYAADTDNSETTPSVDFSGDDEITATITYPTTALEGNEYSYLVGNNENSGAITYAQLQALKAALEAATGASTAGCNGYSIVWAVDSDATSGEGGVVTNNSVTFDLYTGDVQAWKPGCSYIYTILFAGADNGLGGGTDGSVVDLGAAKIYFDVMVNDWASDTTDELENEAKEYTGE